MNRRSPTARLVALAAVLYWAALFLATHLPGVGTGGVSDKLLHAVAYALLALLLAAWMSVAGLATPRRLLVLGTALAVYAALDELLQIPVGRHGDWRDWLADMAGAWSVLLAWAAVLRWRGSTRRAEPAPLAGAKS